MSVTLAPTDFNERFNRAADRAGVERLAVSQSGHNLSGTRTSSAAWMGYLTLGRERQQRRAKFYELAEWA